MIIISGAVGFIFGFCIAAVFDGNSYDKGFDDGWNNRGIKKSTETDHKRGIEEERW